VAPPQGELEHIRYFCGNTEIADDLKAHETQRVALYKAMVALVRAYANISDDLASAGYSDTDIQRIKQAIDRYLKLRETIRNAADEKLDTKAYEADMRHLIDTYIEASEPRTISPFDNMPLLELIVKTGIASAINNLPAGLKASKEAVAETIENNVRSKIIKEHLNDPAYYAKMSALLDEIIAARKAKAIEYEEYLQKVAELAKRVQTGQADDTPKQLNTPGRRALYNLLSQGPLGASVLEVAEAAAPYEVAGADEVLALVLQIDEAVKRARPDGWRDVYTKENVIKAALYDILRDVNEVERIFPIIRQHKEY
jgi:type I restriction enzyme R subunit